MRRIQGAFALMDSKVKIRAWSLSTSAWKISFTCSLEFRWIQMNSAGLAESSSLDISSLAFKICENIQKFWTTVLNCIELHGEHTRYRAIRQLQDISRPRLGNLWNLEMEIVEFFEAPSFTQQEVVSATTRGNDHINAAVSQQLRY